MIDIQAIRRQLNAKADGLAKGVAYDEYEKKKEITILDNCPTDINMTKAKEEAEADITKDNQMKPIIDYLKNSKLLGTK